jgi:aminopeptidase-like protein
VSDMIKVSICDGKYTIIQDASGRTNVLRYGYLWRDATGDNVVLGAAYEIEKLQTRIKRLEEAGDAMEYWCDEYCAGNWRKAKENKP